MCMHLGFKSNILFACTLVKFSEILETQKAYNFLKDFILLILCQNPTEGGRIRYFLQCADSQVTLLNAVFSSCFCGCSPLFIFQP